MKDRTGQRSPGVEKEDSKKVEGLELVRLQNKEQMAKSFLEKAKEIGYRLSLCVGYRERRDGDWREE